MSLLLMQDVGTGKVTLYLRGLEITLSQAEVEELRGRLEGIPHVHSAPITHVWPPRISGSKILGTKSPRIGQTDVTQRGAVPA